MFRLKTIARGRAAGLCATTRAAFCLLALTGVGVAAPGWAFAETSTDDPLLAVLSAELDYSMKNLVDEQGVKPYYIAYSVYDEEQSVLSATLGAIVQDQQPRGRNLNIDLRVGDYKLDNTHQIRRGGGGSRATGSGNIPLPLATGADATRHTLWYFTDREFKQAARRFGQVQTNLKVKVDEEDQSDDFSREEPSAYIGPVANLDYDRNAWRDRVRRVSELARDYPLVYNTQVTLGVFAGTRYLVTSEGTKLRTSQTRFRITLQATTKAEDGMDLSRSVDFNARDDASLPDEATIAQAFKDLMDTMLALRNAPLAEPYIGPAILRNRASGVFFHEIFGHRIEGHRQRDVSEGQTFTKKIGEPVLPPFISVIDDPTKKTFGDTDLRGFYRFDDEGVAAEPVTLVDEGVLRTFLMSRQPLENFPKSNGHGRRAPGNAVAGRQANLIVESKRAVSFDELRAALIEEAKKQEKPYGLLFEDISGGFTTTDRRGPQSFKVLPLVVYKIFTDGRPDELIRGADIVGTPLTSFEKITMTGDDPDVFNGTCGAESGWVPVSAISPSILVTTIEIEKRQRDQSRPPILPSPLSETGQSAKGAK